MEHGTRQMTIGKVSDLFVGPKNEKHENPTLPKTRRIGQSKVQNRHSAETYVSGNIQVGLIVNRKMRKGEPPLVHELRIRIVKSSAKGAEAVYDSIAESKSDPMAAGSRTTMLRTNPRRPS
jgi:hypothetical protein